jgi:inorganic phosphate transporter, PiT family
MTLWLILIIATAFIFDFYNGMKDAANSVATIVSTRVLKPWQAVLWAAFFNFVAAFGGIFFTKVLAIPFLSQFFSLHVATTVGKGIVDQNIVSPLLIFTALLGAILWTAYCLHNGLPISVSHALIGGLVGTALIKGFIATRVLKGALNVLVISGILKTVTFMIVAPILGLVLGLLIMVAVYWLVRNQLPTRIDKHFRKLQLVSAAAYSLGHGVNDAQKTMGIIAVLLFTTPGTFYYPYYAQHHDIYIPFWIVISCHFMIAMGTMAGGWHVIKTLGQRVTKLQPIHGFCAETGGAISLFFASALGAPVSTTHVITGAICGVGATQRLSAVRWGVARSIVWAWILTMPVSAVIAAAVYLVLHLFI